MLRDVFTKKTFNSEVDRTRLTFYGHLNLSIELLLWFTLDVKDQKIIAAVWNHILRDVISH